MKPENILMRNEIKSVSSDSKNIRRYVTLNNGKEIKANRSSKGAYIILDGKRKYIIQGYTYGNPLP